MTKTKSMKTTSVTIMLMVECPYCETTHHSLYDQDWFDENIESLIDMFKLIDFNSKYDTVCSNCKKQFIINDIDY